MVKKECQRPWSDLPTELAGLVLGFLPSHSDRIRFSAVCRNWCIYTKQHCLPPTLPWFMFANGTFFSLPHSASFQVPNSADFHSTCGEWLVFASEDTCTLVNTFSKITLTLSNLYSFCLIDEPDEVINGNEIPYTTLDHDGPISLSKVIVCSELLVAAIIEVGDLGTIALCSPGDTNGEWFVSAIGDHRHLADIVFYEGKLYTVDGWRNLFIISVGEDQDSGELSITHIECLVDGPRPPTRWIMGELSTFAQYLVESHGALLLVEGTIFTRLSESDRRLNKISTVLIEFEVFEADFQSSQWVKVK